MAVVAGIKIKIKAPRAARIAFADEKYTGTEPMWPDEAADWDNDTFDHQLRQSFYYYNYYYSQKDCKKYVVEWLTVNKKLPPADIKAFGRAPDRSLEMTVCSLIMAHRQGMPFRGRHVAYIIDTISKVVASAEPEEIVTPIGVAAKAYVPNIQDRLNEKTSEIIGELEGIFDDIAMGVKNPAKLYEYLVSNNVVQSQLGKYESLYSKRKAELVEAQGKEDAQLKEGYSNFKLSDLKRMVAWITELLAAVEQYRGVKKATKKARVKKAPSKEKVTSKLKYAKDDKLLKLVSVNPATILEAQELWVYNTKTRKLGKYVAEAHQSLSVKGTTIINFDTAKSTSKTLRKPVEKLAEFAKAGKIQLRKFMDDIKATETLLNGRISTDIILLKVQ